MRSRDYSGMAAPSRGVALRRVQDVGRSQLITCLERYSQDGTSSRRLNSPTSIPHNAFSNQGHGRKCPRTCNEACVVASCTMGHWGGGKTHTWPPPAAVWRPIGLPSAPHVTSPTP